MNYKYISKAFSNKIEILSDVAHLSFIQFSSWKSNASVEINGKQYLFKKKSFWGRDLDVLNVDSQEIVAEIIFETWKSKVNINLSPTDNYIFSHQDFWRKNWSIVGKNQQKIDFINTKSFWDKSREIQSDISDAKKSDLLITIGVYLIFYKMRQAAAAASS